MNAEEFQKRYCIDRRGTDCLKWDALGKRFGDTSLISMWVADMEFRTPEAVIEAMTERVKHGIFGYSYVPDSYYAAYLAWEKSRRNNVIDQKWVRFSNGVVVSLYWLVNAFTQPGDAVIVLTPVYYPFLNAAKDTGRKLITCDLKSDEGVYSIDYGKFEQSIVENKVKLFIQCSPHNPVGRVWTEEELATVLDICKRHHVLVVSDEIHQDIVTGEKKQIPAAMVKNAAYADNLITVAAPSKTFNLAGLLNSHVVIPNDDLRARYDAYAKTVNQIEVNIMGMVAAQAAYTHGADWLDGALKLIRKNYEYVRDALAKQAPKIVISSMEGTYLMWLDLRAYVDPANTKDFVQNKCRLAVDYGQWFGENFGGFIRLNMATDPTYVKQAVDNLVSNLKKLKE